MYISHPHRFIYFAPTKVASNSVAIVCEQIFGAIKMQPKDMLLTNDFNAIHNTTGIGYCIDHHSIFLPSRYENYYLFTSTRNPYERELAKYSYLINEAKAPQERENLKWLFKNNRVKTFEEYIDWVTDGSFTGIWHAKDAWKRSMYHQIFNSPVPPNCINIVNLGSFVRTESLFEDFCKLPFVADKHHAAVKKLLDRKYNFCPEWKQFYFPGSCVEKYYDNFRVDFDFFGYPKDPPPHINKKTYIKRKDIKSYEFITFGGRTMPLMQPKNKQFL